MKTNSAKTFLRPEWTKLLADLKKHKGKTHLLLFTKWDRFSRNASDAYFDIPGMLTRGFRGKVTRQLAGERWQRE
jgi:hypothetical protein